MVQASEITAEPLGGAFGVRVTGADLSRPLSPGQLTHLVNLLLEHRVVILPGQSLTNDEYVAFGRRWGDPVILIARNNRLESHPEMIRQGNGTATPEYVRNVASHWHCDSSYEEQVATFTMLYGVESPDEGGETLFADLVAAYDSLPADRRAALDGLTVRHATSAATPLPDEHISDRTKMPDEIRRSVVMLDPVTHPLVNRHPLTGRKALYGLGGSCYGIEGLPEAEGAELLLDLRRYVTQERFRAAYKLMPGDVMIWDNFSVIHRATPIAFSDEPGERRLNYRISLKGRPADYIPGR